MKRFAKWATATVAFALTLGFGAAGIAKTRVPEVDIGALEIAPEATEIESFSMLSRPHSWTPVDDDTVIVWATAFRPYLIELAFPSHDLKFVQAIGVTSVGSRVYAKFDSVQVRGFRYPIARIYELSRDEARNWNRTS